MADSKTLMLVNYQPGDECRIAVVRDGKMEEFDSEPTDRVSRVNNVYVGRVVNVEPAIQAAFVDFGIGQSGFLHVSDLHPMYLGGGDSTERVGRKTPRRERPPIQECLSKGQEVIVQVLKEGVGTKGPTLTSYLSIPGRYLVMMPDMDKVGVSRKVEDEDLRKRMRDILAQLELPDGFGFILRTAGLDRNKTELKRDLAYLQRLWKDIERRRKQGKKPRLLYSESDLLVRSLRDMLSTEIDQVVIDHPSALRRAAKFMKIVSPRAQAKLMQHVGDAPLFHAYGIEQQILAMHSREVPLSSGGALVIDETEALVAIDVNSGKSRGARDAETNAYRTNLEAADEICRQLRLRDLGGLVINDFIDMSSAKNRKAIEQRVRDGLKRDRAKSTILPISQFGILEMTRQRMRGSHERVHFAECPMCRGRGLLQRPGSVAADALREVAAILVNQRVSRVEMVVSARVAGALLSSGRRHLSRLEGETGKAVEVRLSDAIPADRVTFYAYDKSGADIDLDKLPKPKGEPQLRAWTESVGEEWAIDLNEEADQAKAASIEPAPEPPELSVPGEMLEDHELVEDDGEDADRAERGEPSSEEGGKKKRRRRRRRKSKKPDGEGSASESDGAEDGHGAVQAEAADDAAASEEGSPGQDSEPQSEGDAAASEDGSGGPKKKRRRRRRRRKSSDAGAESSDPDLSAGDAGTEAASPSAPEQSGDQDRDELAQPEPDTTGSEPKQPARKKTKRKPAARASTSRDSDESREKEASDPDRESGSRGDEAELSGTSARKRSTKKTKKKPKAASAGSRAGESSASDEAGKPAGKAKGGAASADPAATNGTADVAKQAPRSLYASRRKLSPSERARGADPR